MYPPRNTGGRSGRIIRSSNLAVKVVCVLIQRRRRRELLFHLGEETAQVRRVVEVAGKFLIAEEPVADGSAVGVDALAANAEAALGALQGALGKSGFLGGLPDVTRAAR